jgi:hypothetical protein
MRGRGARRALLALLIGGVFALGVALGAYWSADDGLLLSHASPDGRMRLDYYHPPRWRALVDPNADMPGYARLVADAGNYVSPPSPTLELSGSGPIIWTRTGVQIGAAAGFDRRTGRWSVQ